MTASDAVATEQTNPGWQRQGTTAVSFFLFLVLEYLGSGARLLLGVSSEAAYQMGAVPASSRKGLYSHIQLLSQLGLLTGEPACGFP